MNPTDIVLRNPDGAPILVVSVGMTLYTASWPDFQTRLSILEIVRMATASDVGKYRWLFASFLEEWQGFDEDSLRRVEEMLRVENPDQPWFFALKGGEHWADASSSFIEAMGYPARDQTWGYLRIGNDTAQTFSDPEAAVRRFAEACKHAKAKHGYCGFTVFQSPDPTISNPAESMLFALAQRFPGLDIDIPPIHLAYAPHGIKSVNWLTVVSDEFLEMHKQAELIKADPPCYQVFRGLGFSIFRASATPQLGDRNRQLDCPEYKRVAHYLRPIQLRNHRAFSLALNGPFDREASEAWLRRFE